MLQVYDAPKSWTSTFTRIVYARGDLPKCVLVQYVGDETVAAHFPHGNSKSKSRNYVRTQPHVLRNIANSTGGPQQVYQQLITENAGCSGMQSSAVPRNTRQVWHASFCKG